MLMLLPGSLGAEPVPLGVSAPLSGESAAWGTDLKNILQFAADKIAAGKYRFILEDDRCDNALAVTAAHKLANIDKVPAVFGLCTTTVIASAPVYERAGILLMAPMTTAAAISRAGDNVFRMALSDAEAAGLLAEFLNQRQKRLGVLTEDNTYSRGFIEEFQKSASGLLDVVNIDYSPSDTDFKSLLMQLKTRKIDSLFINSNSERLFSIIFKQAQDLRFALPIYGAFLPGTVHFRKLVPPSPLSIVFVDYPAIEDLLNEEGRRLFQEYISRYGHPRSADYAFPAVFESLRVIDAALTSKERLSSYIYSHSFSGIFGSYSFDENGDMKSGWRHSLKELRHGKIKRLELPSLE